MTGDQLESLAAWYRKEYQRRTKALKNDEAKIDWLNSGTRVSRTEVASYADSIGIEMTVQDHFDLLHYLNRKD